MDDEAALKRLQLLLKEGDALKIVNHFHACNDELVTDAQVASDPKLQERCAAYAEEHGHVAGMPGGYTQPSHYLLHDVVRLEESDKPGTWTAYADDDLGTQCTGQPAALLARLTEWERE